jgi:spore coat polysaccharide biosynthesis protein SpsF
MRIEAFIQARMGSTRLPGKVLKQVLGRPLLDFLVERLAQCHELDHIIILTSKQAQDDAIASFCQEKNLLCFRGSEDDVLDRYYQASLERQPEGIVRITADCPLIDPDIVDQVIKVFRQHHPHADYVSNSLQRTFPRGLDVEVFSFKALEQAFQQAHWPEEREHVTLYLYRHPEKFQLYNVAHIPSLATYRWTVDTPEDFALVRLILEHLYPKNRQFCLNDILHLLKEHPDWNNINAHVEQKKVS